MSRITFGYIIKDGKAEVDVKKAAQLNELFISYLSGLSLINAAKNAGIKKHHGTIARMLTNKRYLGDVFYPQIIKEDIFEHVAVEKLKRAETLGRIREPNEKDEEVQTMQFTIPKVEQIYDDPFKQAEYAYSLIESEMKIDGDQ